MPGDAPPRGKLAGRPMVPLPLGSIKPTGWLRRQLEIQADGLSGHLDEFWPDVADSAWIGGKAEGWERGPYWLDGVIPLAIALEDGRLKAKAQKWVDYILEHQRDDGWLGPVRGNPDQRSALAQYDVWPRFVVLKALTQWHEATGDERVVPALNRFFRVVDKLLDEKPLDEWARIRWADLSLSIYWLYERTGEPWLLELAAKVREQGVDWPHLARDFPHREKITHDRLKEFQQRAGGKWINDDFGTTHGVNIAMGIKAPGVWYRQSHDDGDRAAVFSLLRALDDCHGQATGIFSCDEHLAGRHPSQGTELCAVVEMMFSLETLLSIVPDPRLADRLESLAFNALPATFKDDMWAHQYDQQANQVVCNISPERVYTNNGPEANLFGLEPNFGCCLANMHQGWPKFASHLWMRASGDGLAAVAYAPCEVRTTAGGTPVQITVRTEYPFKEEIEIEVRSEQPARFPIELRIPAWAAGANVSIDGEPPADARPGTFHRIHRQWSGTTTARLKLPMRLRVERRFNHSVTIKRGPLVFALHPGEEWRKLRGEEPRADWEVYPKTAWNYALRIDPEQPGESLQLQVQDVGPIPFSSTDPPLRLTAEAERVPGWELVKNAADAPPKSPVKPSGSLERVQLVPYGCAKLRVTEVPVLEQARSSGAQ